MPQPAQPQPFPINREPQAPGLGENTRRKIAATLALARAAQADPSILDARDDKPLLDVAGEAITAGAYDVAAAATTPLAIPEGIYRDVARWRGGDYVPPEWSPLGQLELRKRLEQLAAETDAAAYQAPGVGREVLDATLRAAPGAAVQVGMAPATVAGAVAQVGGKLIPAEIAAMRQQLALAGGLAASQKAGDALGEGDSTARALARGVVEGGLEAAAMRLAPGGLEQAIRGTGARGVADVAKRLAASAGQEMPEEGIAGATQEAADQLFRDGALDQEQVAKAGLMGMTVGGILGGGMQVPNAVADLREQLAQDAFNADRAQAAAALAAKPAAGPLVGGPPATVPVEPIREQTPMRPAPPAGATPQAKPLTRDQQASIQTPDEQLASDRADFDAFLSERGQDAASFRQAVERTDDLAPQPADEQGVRIGASAIEGKGVLVQGGATAGQPLATAFTADGKRTEVGRFLNHAAAPNSTLVPGADGRVMLVPKRPLAAGEEATIDYRQARQVLDAKLAAAKPAKGKAPKAAPVAPAGPPAANAEWQTFDPNETLGIPRASMPQVRMADRPELLTWLKGQGIRVNAGKAKPDELKPTQAEFAPAKVAQAAQEMAKSKAAGEPVRPIIVSSDNMVIDGHHQLLAARDAGQELPVIRLGVPGAQAIQTIKRFPKAQRSGGAEGPAMKPRGGANPAPTPAKPAAAPGAQTATASSASPAAPASAAAKPVAATQPVATPVASGEQAADTTQAEPAEPAASSEGVAGEATTIDVPGGQDMPARYEVRELDSLIASSSYSTGTPQRDSRYPADLQPRDYAPGSAEDLKVQSFAQGQKAGYYVNTDPSAANGPPTVTANGTVLNGNGRTMSLQLAASRGDMGWYRRELDRQAQTFGIDPQGYAGMRQPVLVRVVRIEPTSEAAKRFARQGNVSSTQAQSPARTAASLGGLVDDGVLDTLELDDDTTFSEAVSGPKGRDFRQALASSLPAQEVPRYLNEQTGQLTDAGKELVRDLLLTKVFPVELVERLRDSRKGLLRGLEGATPQLLRLGSMVRDSRVNSALESALDWIARHPDVTLPTQLVDWMDASGQATQQDLTGRQDGLTPEGRMLAEWLLANAAKPRQLKQGLVSLIKGLDNRASPILGDTRTGGQIAAEALGVSEAPGASFGAELLAPSAGTQMSFARENDEGDIEGQTVASLAASLRAAMPGNPTATILPDGPFGLQITTKGRAVAKVRVATSADFQRINDAAAAKTSEPITPLTPDAINGWVEGSTIYLVPGSATQFTYNHELVHVLKNLGVLAPGEIARLAKLADSVLSEKMRRRIRSAYAGVSPEMLVEEMAAHVIEKMAAGKARPPFVTRVLSFLRDLAAMMKLTTQSDYGLAKDVASGRILDKRTADPGAVRAEPGPAFAKAFPPPRGPVGETSWLLRNGVAATTVLRRIASIPMDMARKMGLAKPADIVLQSGRQDPQGGGGFGLIHLEAAEQRKGVLRNLGMTIDGFLNEAAARLRQSDIYKQGRDYVVVTPIEDAQGRRHKIVLTLRAQGDQLGVHSIGRVERGEVIRGEVVWSGAAIPPNGTRPANPPPKSLPQMAAGEDTRPGADTDGNDIGNQSDGKSDPAMSRRLRGDAPGQMSLFGDQVEAPTTAPATAPAAEPSPVEKAVEKLATVVGKVMEQQATLFDLLAKQQAPAAASPAPAPADTTTGGTTDAAGSAGDAGRDAGEGRAPGRPGGERSGGAGDGGRGTRDGRGRGAGVGGGGAEPSGRSNRGTDADAGSQGELRAGPPGNAPRVDDAGVPRTGPFRFRSVEDAMPPRGAMARARANLAAIKAVRSIQAEGRAATAAERELIARFSGWGSLKWVFDPKSAASDESGKRAVYAEALELLPEGSQERNQAIGSTLNAHYTHPQVVADVWAMVKRGMGDFAGMPMRALEPSVGLGAFVGLEPDGVRGSLAWAAIEKEPATAAMFGAVYPEAATAAMGFEEWQAPDNAFDLAIGNVPFGSIPMFDKRYVTDLGKPMIHDYFFVKTMDKVRPGGLVAFITSTGTMDKDTAEVRQHLFAQADLVHAVRFPADAHDTAGTSVVTDLLILRKRLPGEPKGDRSWLGVGTVKDPLGGDPIPLNNWYKKHPELVLGRIERSGSLWGVREDGQKNPNVVKQDDYQQKLEAAIFAMPKGIMSTPAGRPAFDATPAPSELKNHALVGKDGAVWQNQGGTLVKVKAGKENAERVGWMRSLVSALRRVWEAERAGSEAASERAALNKLYDSGRAKFGALSESANAGLFASDPDAPNLLALEDMKGDPDDENGLTFEKTAIFRQRVVRPPAVVGQARNGAEGVTASMGRTGRVEPELVAEALGVTPEQAIERMRAEGAAYELPSGGWAAAWSYLQGNVKAKLAEARDAAAKDQRFAANVTALEQVQPAPVGADRVAPTLGAPFVPASVMDAFAQQLGPYVKAVKVGDGRWLVSGFATQAANAEWGVRGRFKQATATDVLSVALNRSKPDMDGKDKDDKRLPDTEGTQAVLDKAAELRARFADWIRLPEQADHLAATVQVYNDTVNVYRHGDPDTSWITFQGMIDKYRDDPVRRRSVARALTEGRLMLAHEVGLGKSATMFAVAMEARRLGIARKPMIATINAVVPQLAREAMEAYPGQRVLIQPTAWGDPGTPTGRDTFLSRLATQDYDVAIVSHETLTSIENDAELIRERSNERIAEIRAAKAAAESEKGKDAARSRYVSSLAKMLENEQQKMAELSSHALKRDHVSFADIGTDMLIIDEAHQFKNLPYVTAQEGVLGLGSGSSKRAEDLLMKIRALHKLHGAERGIVLATGTPISNTMTEVFAFQHFLQPGAIKSHGVRYFDDWCRAFGEPKQVQEVQPDGTRKMVTRFANWVNIHGLSRMLRDVFGIGLARDNPRVKNALPASREQVVKVPLTPRQRQYREWIGARLEAIKARKGKAEKGDDVVPVVIGDAMRSSIDMRLVVPNATEADGSKIPATAEGVAELYLRGPKIDGKAPLQFIFQNVQTQPNAWGFSLNAAMIDALVARGVPRNRIAVVDGSMSKRQVAMIKRQAATGRFAVLIGGTEVLGTGTNAQQYAIATWHLDVPHRPADIIQRDGRAVRSGNLHKAAGNTVILHRVVTEGTMDEALWGRVGLKYGFITDIMGAVATPNDAAEMREVDTEALDPEMVAAMASGDMDLVRIIDLEAELGKLRRAKHAHASQKAYLQSAARLAEAQAASYEKSAARLAGWAAESEGKLPEKATLDDGTDSKGLQEKLNNAMIERRNDRFHKPVIGSFAGLPVQVVGSIEMQETTDQGTRVFLAPEVSFAGSTSTAANAAALLGRLRFRVKALPGEAEQDAAEGQRLREESRKATEQANSVGPWPKEAELAQIEAEHAEVKARLAAKPKIASTLTPEAAAAFDAGMAARAQKKADEAAAKDARKTAKAGAAGQMQLSRRLPSYLADIPLLNTSEIAALVEQVHDGLSPRTTEMLERPRAKDARVYTANDLPPEHRPKLAQLYAGIKEADDALAATAEAIAAQFGGSVKRGPIKKPERVIAKAMHPKEGYRDDNGVLGDVSQVLDAFRLTIVAADIATARRMAAAVESVYAVPTGSNGKRRFKDRFDKPLSSGYGDILMNVEVNGKVGEVQLHIPEILAVKDLGHSLYEVERADGATAETQELMQGESRRLYGAGWDAYAARGGIGAPVIRDTQASQSAAVPTLGSVPGTQPEVSADSPPSGSTYRRPTPGMMAETASVSASSNAVPTGSVQDQGKSFMAVPPSTGDDSSREAGAMSSVRTDGQLSRRIGRPDLANPGTTGPVRQLVDEVDEARNQQGEPQRKSDDEREDEAERRFANDPDGERRRIVAKWQSGAFLDDVETRIAHHLINRDGLRAVINRTPDEMIAATKFIAAYRASGSEAARAFRARADRMATPVERVNMLTQAILTPPAETLQAVRGLYEQGKAQEAEALMRKHAEEAAKVLDVLRAQGIDPADLTLPDKLMDPVTITRVLRQISLLRPAKFGDVVLEYWINAILSGPKTQIVNVAGNTLSTTWDMTVQRWAEVAAGMVANADGKARVGELAPMYAAMFRSLPRAFKNAFRSFQAEQDVFSWQVRGIPAPGSPGAGKVEDRAAIKGVKGRIIRVPSRLLTTADSFWKTIIGHGQATAEAYRMGRDQGLSGTALDQHMDQELADYGSMSWHRALGYAEELTFQSEDSTLLKKVQAARNWETVGGVKPLAFVLPFTRTPWNIFGMGLRKSPLGTVALAARLAKEGYRLASKDPNIDRYAGRDAVRHSAEQLLAWAVFLAVLGMVGGGDDDDPMITGTGEPMTGNKGKREAEQRRAPPLSIKIGDTWVSYGRLEPAAVALGMTVDLIENAKDSSPNSGFVAKTGSLLLEQVRNKTFLSGVSDLLNAFEDPDRYGTAYTARFAASWMPNLIRQPLREAQEYVPEGKPLPDSDDDGPVSLWLKAVRDQALPIEAMGPAPKVDVWGREIQRNALQTSWLARMAEGTLSPVTRRQETATQADLIIKDWNDRNPEFEWWPTVPRPYFAQKGKPRIDLTSEQYHQFLLERGRIAQDVLGNLRYDPSRPTEEWQVKQIENALRRATKIAKASILRQIDELGDEQEAQERQANR